MILQAIYKLKIAQFVPVNGAVSFEEIASFTKVDVSIIRRFMRFATTNFFFHEEPSGMIRHSSLSRRLAEDEKVRGAVSLLVNKSYPGSTNVSEAPSFHTTHKLNGTHRWSGLSCGTVAQMSPCSLDGLSPITHRHRFLKN